jgi:hypothetical protein
LEKARWVRPRTIFVGGVTERLQLLPQRPPDLDHARSHSAFRALARALACTVNSLSTPSPQTLAGRQRHFPLTYSR